MKAVVQRVKKACLSVDGELISSIETGLVCYLGVGKGDNEKDLAWLARKVAGLRIFPDADSKMNLSLLDCSYEALVVSQFTLYGNVKKGFRPSFIDAEDPERARILYEDFCSELVKAGVSKVAKGVFAADMLIEQENSGPVTIIIDSRQTL
ncbi:MAG: D-tyrosyl-tRNA(Tyr) deacylase [Candidatus Riflebacteria bacterium HGW-Riflebacteria-1]|jgi:D-tyrosyl-tRNA(Tyr) deacylase|nr:MAG: D-tyrosyl-tRNA(Tyr) deacylase [Candidatus Riflebacteria bacterium HGW-Riflebacteria-1]